ncbi:MAG: GNAT family N-acetyltransferase [Chloroflexi bacterium]|nr:MAG: GNAT family N-acetyltransferase [Chloroflexota bacterium]
MTCLVEPLPWDSEFFGLPIGKITVCQLDSDHAEKVLAEAERQGLACLYFQANPDDPETVTTAERYGFHLVDVRVVLEHPFDNRPAPVPRYPVPSNLVIDSPRQDEIPRLQDISAQISFTSRYQFDSGFGPVQSERLYRLWIEKACHGYADVVFVARWGVSGEAVGLITCTLDGDTAHIQLAGVDTAHRRSGVGTGLVQAALDWARGQDVRQMQVVTQARNVGAQRLYQQMGFFTREMTLYYHKWLKK